MSEELIQPVPLAAGIVLVVVIVSFLGWFWDHPAVFAAVVAGLVWLGYRSARRARV